jgi:hypothetical protein
MEELNLFLFLWIAAGHRGVIPHPYRDRIDLTAVD